MLKMRFFALSALLSLMSHAFAQMESFDKKAWLALATQTCIKQAPQNAWVQSLNLNSAQLRYSCRCVADDMLTLLPLKERQQLMQSMKNQRNVQQVSAHIMSRSEVKQAALACSAAAWWN